jgi:hypothetical protein
MFQKRELFVRVLIVLVLFALSVCLADVASVGEKSVLIEFVDARHVSEPVARGDLVVVHRYEEGPSGVTIKVQATTSAAEAWLLENAPEFGSLEELTRDGEYFLRIQPEVYDVSHVLAWLLLSAARTGSSSADWAIPQGYKR